jgi:Ca-activated chloride channel family protein
VSFGSPDLLVFLLAVPVAALALALAERRRAARSSAWSTPALLPNMTSDPGRRRLVPTILFLVGASLLLVGFARPEARFTEIKPGATVVLALDDSGSMAAPDVPPTRLRAADAMLTRFVDQLPSRYRVALVVFSADQEVKVAPTYDHAEVVAALPRTAQQQGTALGDGLALAVRVADQAVGPKSEKSKRPPASVLLVSDGGQNEGRLTPAQASARATKAGVPVSTIVIGTAQGIVTQRIRESGSSQTVPLTTQVPVQPQPLRQIATDTGGTFFQAPSNAALASVYRSLGKRLVHDRELREITALVSGVAIVLILAGALLSGHWFRRLV